ncbi:MAG: HipA domain-containing protein [Eubacteriales bacterium]|nr:HipA domain-containing protein [Eubacteriales bacterium]
MGQTDHFVVAAGWLPDSPVIGTCFIDRARGAEVISFEYSRKWVAAHPNLAIDPDLLPMPGRQYPPKGKPCFGFLSDASPYRWGRRLLERREAIDARREGRPPRKLMESDFLLGVHDGGRMGGIRFRDDEGTFLSDRESLAAPPIARLRELQNAVFSLETNDGDEERWIRALVEPGSSLGGARPKANVAALDGNLWIAKFPSRHDEWNIGAWEMVAHDLAALCGIRVPEASLSRFSEVGDTFLVRRFDRTGSARLHFASAMNLLGETDGSSSCHSYLDLVEILESFGADAEADIRELYRRMVLSICISNTDDHLRNHGFLLSGEHWKLSPAYDVNPVPDQTWLSLAVNFDDPSRDLRLALEVADYFRMQTGEAIETISVIQNTVRKKWPHLADRYGIAKNEQKRMSPAFEECGRDLRQA